MDPEQFVRSLEKKHKSLTHLCVFSFLKSHPFIIMVCLSCGGNIQFTCPHSNQVSDAKNCTHTASELRVGVALRQTCCKWTGLNNYLFISDRQVDRLCNMLASQFHDMCGNNVLMCRFLPLLRLVRPHHHGTNPLYSRFCKHYY